MRISSIAALCLSLAAAGCETIDGDGYLTHSSHRLNAAERAAVQAGMNAYLRVPVSLSGLRASYRLDGGAIAVCGYASGQVGGKATPPAIFAGSLIGGRFSPLRVPGKGQDPQRIATVRAFCQAEQVSI